MALSPKTKKLILRVIKLALSFYLIICLLLYFFQEKLIFLPQKTSREFKFQFTFPYQEILFTSSDGTELHSLLFKMDTPKGVIFYLHGNAGSLQTWGEVAQFYNSLNYDVFMLDYRGYGKSEGNISSEKQLFQDVQLAYEQVKSRYDESKIIVLGYSIGTGMAAMIAAKNNPSLLILQAPYYSLSDLMKDYYPIIPTFILKYKLETYQFIKQCKPPVVIFHGGEDEVIYYGSSVKLKEQFKPGDTLIKLNNQTHNGMTDNPEYQEQFKKIINSVSY